MNTAGVIRNILVIDMAALAFFALSYLRLRRLGWMALCGWGLLALCLPVLGPFLVIVNRPGEWHPDPFPSRHLRNKVGKIWPGLLREVRYQRMRKTFHRK